MRLLHVIEHVGLARRGDWSLLAARTFIDAAPEHEHALAIVGTGAAERRAAVLGVGTTDRLNPGVGWASAGPGVCAFERDRGPFDRIVRWGSSPSTGLFDRHTRAPCALVDLAPPDAASRSGPGVVRVYDLATDAVPMVDARHADREATRRALGVASDEFCVALVGHADDDRAGAQIVFAMGLVAASGRRLTGVVPVSAGRRGRARRLHQHSRLPSRMVFTDLPELHVACAADAVVVCPRMWLRDGDSLSHGWWEVDPLVLLGCVRAGVCCVVPGTDRASALIEGIGAPTQTVVNTTSIEIARALLDPIDAGIVGPRPPAGIDDPWRARRFAEEVLEQLEMR